MIRTLSLLAAAALVSQTPAPSFSVHKYQMKVGDETQGTLALSYLGSPVKLQRRFERDTSTQSHVDPLTRIGELRNVGTVLANGRIYDPAPLWKSIGWQTR